MWSRGSPRARSKANGVAASTWDLQPRRLDAGFRRCREQDGGDVLATEPVAGARLGQTISRRRACWDRHPGLRRRVHPDREVFIGKIDRESRLDVALEHLGRPIGLEMVVARQRVCDHLVHRRCRKPELAAERQRLRRELARRHGEKIVDDLHGDAAALRPAMDDLVAHRFKDRARTLEIAGRGADHEQALAALGERPTAASTKRMPLSPSTAPNERLAAGSMVLMSIIIIPARPVSRSPPGPLTTPATSGVFGSMVMTTSAAGISAARLLARLAPLSTSTAI